MLIFLHGPDTFRSRQQLKKMIVKFKHDRDPQGLNVVVLDAEKTEPGKIMEQVLATPFLAERRMVVIENLLVSKNQDLMKDLLQRIEDNKISEATVLLFWEGTSEFKNKAAKELFACLEKEKYAQSFTEITGAKLLAWIDSEVKERGGKIERDAVQYLAQNVGGDMWRLNSLLDQLVAYSQCHSERPEGVEESLLEDSAKDSKISSDKKDAQHLEKGSLDSVPKGTALGMTTVADVQLFLDEKADDNIFNLVDAIVGKQPKAVYKMIQEQYQKGEDAQYIFSMILRQFRILLEMRDLFERDDAIQSNVLAQKLDLHPFVVKKSLPLVKKYKMEELKEIYSRLLELDIQTKTGQGGQELLLDLFVGRVCVS
jgi:DNA polymerase-3 subunit delta